MRYNKRLAAFQEHRFKIKHTDSYGNVTYTWFDATEMNVTAILTKEFMTNTKLKRVNKGAINYHEYNGVVFVINEV